MGAQQLVAVRASEREQLHTVLRRGGRGPAWPAGSSRMVLYRALRSSGGPSMTRRTMRSFLFPLLLLLLATPAGAQDKPRPGGELIFIVEGPRLDHHAEPLPEPAARHGLAGRVTNGRPVAPDGKVDAVDDGNRIAGVELEARSARGRARRLSPDLWRRGSGLPRREGYAGPNGGWRDRVPVARVSAAHGRGATAPRRPSPRTRSPRAHRRARARCAPRRGGPGARRPRCR